MIVWKSIQREIKRLRCSFVWITNFHY